MLIIDTQKGNNNKHSGGLPHSEIHGSKLILSSPWLIAEYHVFHRLLLPRHPPNALFALDLIQKKSDVFVFNKVPEDSTLVHMQLLLLIKSHTFPPKHMSVYLDYECYKNTRVSVLDLDNSVRFSSGYRQKASEKAKFGCRPDISQGPN